MKVYQIFTISIWNNIELLGFYKNLDDAVDDINGCIFSEKYKLQKGDLKEYPSTFSMVFDTTVRDCVASRITEQEYDSDDDDLNTQIRGFILDSDEIIKEINNL